jgi:hypothetical protein
VFTAETRLYLRSPTRLAFLTRAVEFVFPPRVDEWVKLHNAKHGNYFAIRIAEITHVEKDGVDVMLEALDLEEEELDEYIASYQAEGWLHKSTKPRWDVAGTKGPEGSS